MYKPISHKLYILVDKTLKPSQQAVQACHAAIEFAKAYPDWKHESLVLLGVSCERELLDYYKRILGGYMRTAFVEPHWDNRMTAIACYGCDEYVTDLNLI